MAKRPEPDYGVWCWIDWMLLAGGVFATGMMLWLMTNGLRP